VRSRARRASGDTARLRDPFPPEPFPAVRRSFEFARSHGGWVVDGEFWDVNRIVANLRLNDTELWTLKNGGGGWWHPIHIHLALFLIQKRNGAPPPAHERAFKDTVVLEPGWTFLTGSVDACEDVRRGLGLYDPDPRIDADKTQHSGLLVMGNDKLGRWSTVSLGMRPERIVQALDRVMLPADQWRNEAWQI
jgi:hypothetical protein